MTHKVHFLKKNVHKTHDILIHSFVLQETWYSGAFVTQIAYCSNHSFLNHFMSV